MLQSLNALSFLSLFSCLLLSFNLSSQVLQHDLNRGHELFAIATELANNYKHQESIDSLERALVIFKAHDAWDNYLVSSLVKGRNYYQLGEIELVENAVEESKKIFNTKDCNGILMIQVCFLEGQVLHAKGQYESAIEKFDAALNVWNSNPDIQKAKKNPILSTILQGPEGSYFGHIYNSKAFAILAMGDYQKALDYFRQSRGHYKESENIADTILADINIGTVYLYKGEIDQSIQWFEGVLVHMPRTEKTIPHIALIYNYLSELYHLKENYKAERKYLDLLKKMFGKPEIINLLSLTGTSSELAYFTLLSKDIRHLSITGTSTEVVLQKTKDLEEKVKLIDGLRESKADIFARLGDVYMLSENFMEALGAYQEGLQVLTIGMDISQAFKNPDIDKVYFKIGATGLLEKKVLAIDRIISNNTAADNKELLKLGLQTAELGIVCMEIVRMRVNQHAISQISKESSLLDLERKATRLFDLYTDFAYQLYEKEKDEHYLEIFFKGIEQSKSYALRQSLADLEMSENFSKEVLNQWSQMETEILIFEKRLAKAIDSGDKTKEDQLRKSIFDLKEKLAKTTKKVEANPLESQAFDLLRGQKVVSLPEAENKVVAIPLTSIIEYYESENFIYALHLCPNNKNVFKYQKPESWSEWISELNALHQDLDLVVVPKKVKRYLQLNDSLYNILLKDILPSLPSTCQRLVFVPHGAMHNVNFGVLLTNFGKPDYIEIPKLGYRIADFSKLDYLICDYAVSYAASVTLLFDGINKLKQKNGKDFSLIGFAPAYKNRNSFEKEEQQLAPLPDEFLSLMDFFEPNKIKIFKGEEVTADLLKDTLKELSTDILHISAHAKINERQPLFSKIMFAKYKNKDEDLEVGELYSLKNNARLTILSTCGSGEGSFVGGSGRISLGRGFAHGNCPSQIVSLWDLDALSNQQLITGLYEQLIVENNTIDQSLQQAQQLYLKQQFKLGTSEKNVNVEEREKALLSLHPSYWGGLVAMGVMNPLSSK